eukprot:4664122-Pyramimonas_sp.AAC.1
MFETIRNIQHRELDGTWGHSIQCLRHRCGFFVVAVSLLKDLGPSFTDRINDPFIPMVYLQNESDVIPNALAACDRLGVPPFMPCKQLDLETFEQCTRRA